MEKYILELDEKELEYLQELMENVVEDVSTRLIKKAKKFPFVLDWQKFGKSILDKLCNLKR